MNEQEDELYSIKLYTDRLEIKDGDNSFYLKKNTEKSCICSEKQEKQLEPDIEKQGKIYFLESTIRAKNIIIQERDDTIIKLEEEIKKLKDEKSLNRKIIDLENLIRKLDP